MTEAFTPIPSTGGIYGADRTGRIGRLVAGQGTRAGVMRPVSVGAGYLAVTLSIQNRRRRLYVHRMVWEAFNGAIPQGMQINHINGDKANNRLDNLELCTPSQNQLHSRRILGNDGGSASGRFHPKAKLTDEIVREMRQMRASGLTYKQCGGPFGVQHAAARKAILGITWGHVT